MSQDFDDLFDVPPIPVGLLKIIPTADSKEFKLFQDYIWECGRRGYQASARAVEQLRPLDHEIAAAINELRSIAVEFHNTQQLRERIAQVVVPLLKRTTAVHRHTVKLADGSFVKKLIADILPDDEIVFDDRPGDLLNESMFWRSLGALNTCQCPGCDTEGVYVSVRIDCKHCGGEFYSDVRRNPKSYKDRDAEGNPMPSKTQVQLTDLEQGVLKRALFRSARVLVDTQQKQEGEDNAIRS